VEIKFNTKFEIGQTVYWFIGYDIRKGKVSWIILEGFPDGNDNSIPNWKAKYRVEYFNGMTCHDSILEDCLYGSLTEIQESK
jgi:hypothetical protein